MNGGSDIDWGNSIFTGLRNGGCSTYRSGDSFATGAERSRVGKSQIGSSAVRVVEPRRREKNEGYLSWPAISKEDDEGSR